MLGSRYAGTGVLHDDTISLLAIDVSLRCAKCFLCSSLGPGGGTACNPFESMRLPRAPEPRIHYATSGAAQSERARAVWGKETHSDYPALAEQLGEGGNVEHAHLSVPAWVESRDRGFSHASGPSPDI